MHTLGKKTGGQKNQSIWMVAGAAAAAVAVLIGASLYTSRGGGARPATQSDKELGVVRGVYGPATAKVKVIEYSDYL